MSKDTAFNEETAQNHTFLCSDLQCLPPGDPKILCAKHEYPITGKSFIPRTLWFSPNHPLERVCVCVRETISPLHFGGQVESNTVNRDRKCPY